jgi:hypothetical protein
MKIILQIFSIIVIVILLSGCDNWAQNPKTEKIIIEKQVIPEFWEKMTVPENTNLIYSNCIKGFFLAGTNDGKIFYSNNYGNDWLFSYSTSNSISFLGSEICGNVTKYLAANDLGIYLSPNGQTDWSLSLSFTDKDKPAKINDMIGTSFVFGKFGKYNSYYKDLYSWRIICVGDSGMEIKKRFAYGSGSPYWEYYAFQHNSNAKIFRKYYPESRNSYYIDFGSGSEIYNLVFNENKKTLFVPTNLGLFTSFDMGNSWNITDFSGIIVRNVIIYKNFYYAATEKGLFLSNNYGNSWNDISPYPNCSILSLAITSDSVLYIKTYKNEFFFHRIKPSMGSRLFNLVPILILPKNGQVGLDINVDFKWSEQRENTILWYFLQISKDPNFSGEMSSDLRWLTQPYCSITGLSNQTKYYWRVRAGNPDTSSVWSEVWSFTTK